MARVDVDMFVFAVYETEAIVRTISFPSVFVVGSYTTKNHVYVYSSMCFIIVAVLKCHLLIYCQRFNNLVTSCNHIIFIQAISKKYWKRYVKNTKALFIIAADEVFGRHRGCTCIIRASDVGIGNWNVWC